MDDPGKVVENRPAGCRRVCRVLVLGMLAGILAFIWTNSMRSKADSLVQSNIVLAWLRPLLLALFGEDADVSHIVRKCAHFTEFAALGMVLAMIRMLWNRSGTESQLVCAFGIMAAALTDETIQIFFQRGSMVQDVWLDFAGGVFGLAVMTLLLRFVRNRKKQQKQC